MSPAKKVITKKIVAQKVVPPVVPQKVAQVEKKVSPAWTKDYPILDGWYWTKQNEHNQASFVPSVVHILGRKFVNADGNVTPIHLTLLKSNWWSGPIVPPK